MLKVWVEQTKDGRFKFIERYVDPYTEKTRKKLKKHSKITINQISLLVSCIKNGMNIISSMLNVLAI